MRYIPAIAFLLTLLIVGCMKSSQPQPVSQPIPQSETSGEVQNSTPAIAQLKMPSIEENVVKIESKPVVFDKVRFQPQQNMRGPLAKAVQERAANGVSGAAEYSLDDALKMGETLRRDWPELEPLDDRQLEQQHGIRVIESQHLTLYTDVPSSPAVDELGIVFDLAVPEYCRYFGVDPENYNTWQMRGFLIGDMQKFRDAQLIGPYPTKLEGFSIDHRWWVKEQRTDYYRRHLVVHEGVHGFMNHTFGTCGPPWFMEALAEYLGTHRWENGKLTLGVMPTNPTGVPFWSRIELVRQAVEAGELRTIDEILRLKGNEIETPADYATVWALGSLLDHHERYQTAFREMPRWLTFPDFTNRFYQRLADDWDVLQLDWGNFVDGIDYGYDFERNTIAYKHGQPLLDDTQTIQIDAAHGWQSSGIVLQAGQTYQIKAIGRYQLGPMTFVSEEMGSDSQNVERKIIWSEPNGVTFDYERGRPLGVLLAIVIPESLFDIDAILTFDQMPFASLHSTPFVIGTETTVTPQHTGTVYFRVNDSASQLADNIGHCDVAISRQK